MPDPLLECLLVVVALHGGVLSREAAVAGLPLEGPRLTPALTIRAAKRAALLSRVAHQPLERLNESLCPSILLLHASRPASCWLGTKKRKPPG